MDRAMEYSVQLVMTFIIASLLINKAQAVSCYECDSSVDMTCGETLADGHTLEPSDCSHLQEPQYCVKMTGLYEAICIYCYQCVSTVDSFCPEKITQIHRDSGYVDLMQPQPCDKVFEARYCIKTTGLFEGELGTKRFCSARDFGNYCEMVRRPGDERLYRACVYTCETHSCNSSTKTEAKYASVLMCILSGLALRIKWLNVFS